MSKSMLKGLHRRAIGIGVDDQVMAPFGIEAGGDGKPTIAFPSDGIVAMFDDFLGDLVADEWAYVESDTGYSGLIATATNGIFRITGSETQGVTHEAAGALTQGLVKNWKLNSGGPQNGRLRLTARVKIGTVSTVAESGRSHAFIGFSDSGGAEFPAYDTGAGVISNAADVVGFLWAPTSATATGWKLISAKSTAGDSGDQLVDTTTTPVTNTYTTLEVEVRSGHSDTGGRAHFWIDGIKKGSIDSPVNSAIAMTPWLGMWIQDTGFAGTFDIDYVAISAPRDTGE